MSDLQIGLAMLGVLVVAAVVAFNWWQERKFRRRGQEAFSQRHDDILLDQAPAGGQAAQEARIEPSMEPRLEPRLDAAPPVRQPAALPATDVPHPEVDYIIEIRAGEFIPVDRIVLLQTGLPVLQRRMGFDGLNYQTKAWEPLVADDERYTSLRVALQLVDRTGAVNDQQLREFGEAVRSLATGMSAIAELPELAPALERARALDAFCADVDVLVGINVIAGNGQVFHGTKIRALAEAAGLQLQPDGVFHCRDERGAVLYALDNQESEPFLAERIRAITTPGITFLLDVPRVQDGLRAFDRMVGASRSFADSLDGMLADDNRALLNDSGLDRIRTQLQAIYASMEQRGIPPGSPLALRLFS
ncbi:MAG TPA: cell division protein ZipA C-terminal FtsZ-binding domain-containing protein [Burkholderiales bacterium]|nr:cell division protein ZipA C-terminal FtsZ-binding domain-containing protein [Burkholderiales bacterium]